MSCPGRLYKKKTYFALALTFALIALAAQHAEGQTPSPAFNFRSGQAMYIVAFRLSPLASTVNPADMSVSVSQQEYVNYDLDAERKVRKRIEEWQFFKVAEKLSEADFIFLVNLDESSIEALAIPIEAYRVHFKEKFDLDALRDAAYGRYLIGPLKIATVTRLSDRLVKQVREKITRGSQLK